MEKEYLLKYSAILKILQDNLDDEIITVEQYRKIGFDILNHIVDNVIEDKTVLSWTKETMAQVVNDHANNC